MKIIAITGTKGKTTVTRVLSEVIHRLGDNVLRVDTDGHFVNGKQKSDEKFSIDYFRNVIPTVCPGRYLIEMRKYHPNFTAVFEESFGCRGVVGLGYRYHDVGIFTNVFDDHLGTRKSLKNKRDMARTKSFIFSRIGRGGWAVFNADNRYVAEQLGSAKKDHGVNLIPVGLNLRHFDIKKHVKSGGKYITLKDNHIVIVSDRSERKLIDVKKVSWTFEGEYMPSIWNLMLIIGGLIAYNNGKVNKDMIEEIQKVDISKAGGRLMHYVGGDGNSVLIDFAHEKQSLTELSKLTKKLSSNKTIGVLRIAPDRPNKVIEELGRIIANKFDDIVVYDKIDGVSRKQYKSRTGKFDRKIGEVSNILYRSIKANKKSGKVYRHVIEKDALKKAKEITRRGDSLAIIFGNKHDQTIKDVKSIFGVK